MCNKTGNNNVLKQNKNNMNISSATSLPPLSPEASASLEFQVAESLDGYPTSAGKKDRSFTRADLWFIEKGKKTFKRRQYY